MASCFVYNQKILFFFKAEMKNILFHVLKGKNGWSFLDLRRINVLKVQEMSCRERLFKFYDEEFPFVLDIEYAEDKTDSVFPIFTSGGTIFVSSHEDSQTITKRYKTSKEVYQEISDIKKKQNELKRVCICRNFFKKRKL
jgi:hypothetical protein